MGKIKKHPPVKLIVGFISSDEKIIHKAISYLENFFGKTDFDSPILPFIHTDYYRKEFGENLKRKFITFKKLITPDALAKIKKITNTLEQKLSTRKNRTINIDPGYLDLSKLVLATTKDYTHRIYLSRGIYAEVTLFYQHKTFKPWEWTYPDYKTPGYIALFNHIRDIYVQQKRTK